MVAAITKPNASVKEDRQQARKSGSEVLSAQRVIKCVVSATFFHWSHNRGNGLRGQWAGFIG